MRTNIDYLFLQGRLVDKKKIESRKNELIQALSAERDRRLEKQYKESIEATCAGYDPQEMRSYLNRELEKSKYFNNHKTYDDLEDALTAAQGKRVVFLLDEYHDEFLKCHHHLLEKVGSYEKTFSKDDWKSAKVACEGKIPEGDLYVVLLYNASVKVLPSLKKRFGDAKVYTPYKNFSRKLKSFLQAKSTNTFERLLENSFEAQRRKDWDAYFPSAK